MNKLKLALINGTVIVGDKKSILEKTSVIVENGIIQNIVKKPHPSIINDVNKVIDLEDKILMPGIINNHAHQIVPCKTDRTIKEASLDKVIKNLNKHLLSGTTTILSVDGFQTMEEVIMTNKIHPINIKACTRHTPLDFIVAQLCLGHPLEQYIRNTSASEMIKNGAVAFGELGMFLGGSASFDHSIIPVEIQTIIGKEITSIQAKAIRYAVLGRELDPCNYNYDKINNALKEIGIAKYITAEEIKKLIQNLILPSYYVDREQLKETAKLAKTYDVPMIVHNSYASIDYILELLNTVKGLKFIAAHSNSTSYNLNEMLYYAKKLKKHGAIIDVSVLDSFFTKQICESPEGMFMLFKEGLVDTISTDYGGGNWDSILLAIQEAVKENVLDLPEAVSKATSNVTNAIPNIAPNRGLIAKGKIADLIVTEREELSKVDMVIIKGNIVVEGGKLIKKI